MLKSYFQKGVIEAGLDEAGRGCLAGRVYAAAVILPPNYKHPLLNDSKQLTARQRYALRTEIERDAVAWAVAWCTAEEIDQMNILRASIESMHRAVAKLTVRPEALIVDGNKFTPFENIPHTTHVKGDGKFMSIAAASILAKTYRDDYMKALHQEFPMYGWDHNAGYPTKEHRKAIEQYGLTPHHRVTFHVKQVDSPAIPFEE